MPRYVVHPVESEDPDVVLWEVFRDVVAHKNGGFTGEYIDTFTTEAEAQDVAGSLNEEDQQSKAV